MAANFWISSHWWVKQYYQKDKNKFARLLISSANLASKQWLLTKEQVAGSNPKDRELLPDRDIRKIAVYFLQVIQQLAERVGLRQLVVGAASVYFQRFYVRNSFAEYAPSLIAPTCLFLAAKVTECNTHARVIEKGMLSIDKDWQFAMPDLLENEYYVLEEMDFYLQVYQPYEPLLRYLPETGVGDACLETAWYIVNDSFKTSVVLLHPPHVIALASILLASHQHRCDLSVWFSKLNIDMGEVWAVVESLLVMYDVWKEVQGGVTDCLARLRKS